MLSTYVESSLVPLHQAPDEQQIEVYDYASDSDLGYDTDGEGTESSLSDDNEVATQDADGDPNKSLETSKLERTQNLDKPSEDEDFTELEGIDAKEDGRFFSVVLAYALHTFPIIKQTECRIQGTRL